MDEAFFSQFQIRRLGIEERVATFNCGDEDLNDFIINEALPYRRAMLAVTYVFEHKQTKQVAAFFSLAHDKVSISDFENNTEFNRFRHKRFINEKRLRSYPAIKLCRFGVDESVIGHQIGSNIIKYIKTLYALNNRAGCRFLTVDAYNSAVPFYEHNGFLPLGESSVDQPTKAMFFDLNDIEKELKQ